MITITFEKYSLCVHMYVCIDVLRRYAKTMLAQKGVDPLHYFNIILCIFPSIKLAILLFRAFLIYH